MNTDPKHCCCLYTIHPQPEYRQRDISGWTFGRFTARWPAVHDVTWWVERKKGIVGRFTVLTLEDFYCMCVWRGWRRSCTWYHHISPRPSHTHTAHTWTPFFLHIYKVFIFVTASCSSSCLQGSNFFIPKMFFKVFSFLIILFSVYRKYSIAKLANIMLRKGVNLIKSPNLGTFAN